MTHVKEWMPAPGVSTADLYKRLQQKGEQHLIAPSTLLSPDIGCDFNGANALEYRCINFIHWVGAHPWVHILDHTGPQWPVYSSASIWNQSTALDVGYGWYTNGCPAGAHCPKAYDASYGATSWRGQTLYQYDTYNQFIDGSVMLEFNDYYAYTSSELQQMTCHEMGHAIGLDHDFSLLVWLYPTVVPNASRYPAAVDYTLPTEIYR